MDIYIQKNGCLKILYMDIQKELKSWRDVEALLKHLVPVETILDKGFVATQKAMGLKSLQTLHNRLNKLAAMISVKRNDIVTSGKSARLTPLGKRIQVLCTAIQDEVTRFYKELEALKNATSEAQVQMRLAIVSSIWEVEQDWMKSEFEQHVPALELVAEPYVASVVESKLIEGKADVAITYSPKFLDKQRYEDFYIREWRREPLVLVVSKACADRARNRRPHMFTRRGKGDPKHVSPSDISSIDNKNFYLMAMGAKLTELVTPYLERHHIKIEPRRLKYLQTVKEAVTEVGRDTGISILPVGNAEATEDVVIFRLEEPLSRDLSVLYPKDSLHEKMIELFIKSLSNHDEKVKSGRTNELGR